MMINAVRVRCCLDDYFCLLQEWGDPRKEEFYFYMKSYSPVDNVSSFNLMTFFSFSFIFYFLFLFLFFIFFVMSIR